MSVDGTHLVASVARKRRSEISPPKVQRHIAPDVNLNARISNSRSFSDVVRASQNPPQAYIPRGRAQAWLQRSIFGVLKAPMPISKLREAFASFNLSDFNIIPLGGVSFLFRFQRIDDMMDFLNNKPELIDYLFNVFRVWQEGDFAKDRLCWTLFKGIPPQVWSWEFFQFVSTRIGTMIDWSMDTKSGDRLDVAEILILTPNKKFIDTVISVKVGDKDCVIGIAESQYDPLDWEWSSVQSTGNDRQVEDPLVASPAVSPTTPAISKDELFDQQKTQSPVHRSTATSTSEDPFGLRPIINKGFQHAELTTAATYCKP
ncbi:hypothetical protein Tsubulata_017751 [Turnera subulata]|uniref:DUF4283 domain-containing protein n=1 Tax=Turnera subulata TaxID=218843 RepID=A0A9Q0GH27_9ROSI|nr:hypothetical protein Tsubulata_017751 [Turnera subulata]